MQTVQLIKKDKWMTIILWSGIIVLGACLSINNTYQNTMKSIHNQAILSLEKDLVYREWVSSHGGVYVPATEKTPPNPYLSHIKQRDIVTPDGLTLTLINPAYMTRQVNDMVKKKYDYQGHLTSLNPIRPETAPDEWEKKALTQLKYGQKEFSEMTSLNGHPFFRLMVPFLTEESCLKCHAQQGYKIGDQRGGISISLPMNEPLQLLKSSISYTALGYSAIWLIGLTGIMISSSRMEKQIKEMDKVRHALMESEERYNLAITGANVGMWDCNMVTKATTYNETWAKMLGYELSEIKPDMSAWEDIIHPQDKDFLMGELNKHIKDESIDYDAIFRARTKSGDWKWINTKGKVFEKDENNIPSRVVGIHIDINERKKIEEALRESEEKYRSMMESMQDSVYICSQHYRIEYLNPVMKERIGEDATGKICHKAIYHSPEICSWCDFNDISQGKTVSSEIRNPIDKKDYSIMSVPVYHRDGKVSKLTIARDITNIKSMTAQLLQSEKMASIGQLAAGVAHEINNPIGFISSNLKTLSDYYSDLETLIGKYRNLVEHIEGDNPSTDAIGLISGIKAAEKDIDIDFIIDDVSNLITESREGTDRVKNIVNDLKNFAHPGDNKPSQVDINKSIETSLNVVWNELKYKVNVTKDFGDLSYIKGYPQQLNQVFMNLLVNAAHAIEEKGDILIKTQQQNGWVVISFSDTGHGIPEEHLSKLFDPFFTTKEVGKGTGLGLNIVFNIIQKHNGTIDVKSSVGQGTTFTIKLPEHNDDPDDGFPS